LISNFKQLIEHRELLFNLISRELKVKYKRSVFGFLWSFANPLVLVAVYSIIAGKVMGMDNALLSYPGYHGKTSFAVFLISGLLAWNYFSNSLVMSVGSLVDSGGLVKKIYFPREIIPFASVLANLVTFGIELSVLFVFLTIFGFYFYPMIPVLILIIIIESFFILGMSLLASYSNVFFRDTKHLLNIMLMIWFWACPIIYPFIKVEQLSTAATHYNLSWVPFVYKLNPMASIILIYQRVLYFVEIPSLKLLAYTGIFSAVFFLISYAFFKKQEEKIAGEI